MGLTLDLVKSIDSVLSIGLLFKLYEHNVKGSLCKVMESFLCSWKFSIHLVDYNSSEFQKSIGLPKDQFFHR